MLSVTTTPFVSGVSSTSVHVADVDVAAEHGRLTGGDALGVLELHGDGRTLLRKMPERQPCAEQGRR